MVISVQMGGFHTSNTYDRITDDYGRVHTSDVLSAVNHMITTAQAAQARQNYFDETNRLPLGARTIQIAPTADPRGNPCARPTLHPAVFANSPIPGEVANEVTRVINECIATKWEQKDSFPYSDSLLAERRSSAIMMIVIGACLSFMIVGLIPLFIGIFELKKVKRASGPSSALLTTALQDAMFKVGPLLAPFGAAIHIPAATQNYTWCLNTETVPYIFWLILPVQIVPQMPPQMVPQQMMPPQMAQMPPQMPPQMQAEAPACFFGTAPPAPSV